MATSAPIQDIVLLVDDDPAIANVVTEYFRAHALDAYVAFDLASARAFLRSMRFDVVVLDMVIGREDGKDLARELTHAGKPPFVIMSALKEETDRVVGIELGAYDYITKPFSLRELLARVQGVIRHSREPKRTTPRRRVAHVGGWTIDLSAFRARHESGRDVELTTGEIGVLRALLSHPRRVLQRHELLAMTRRDDGAVFARTIDVLIARLRKKVEDDARHPSMIRTVHGEGYELAADVDWEVFNT